MSDKASSSSLLSSALSRFRAQLGLKILMTLTLPTTLTMLYFMIQRNIVFPTWNMPATFLDRTIPFRPHWVWIYLSVYVLSPIGPALTRSREKLVRYAIGVAFYSVVAFIFFILFPIAAPRPVIAQGDPLYEHMVRCDRVYNSVPSLHAACGLFGVLYAAYAWHNTSRPRLRIFLIAVGWIWFALILYSTVATKQHYVLDLPPGLLLGWWTLRLVKRLPAPYLAIRSTPEPALANPELSQQ